MFSALELLTRAVVGVIIQGFAAHSVEKKGGCEFNKREEGVVKGNGSFGRSFDNHMVMMSRVREDRAVPKEERKKLKWGNIKGRLRCNHTV